MIKLWRIICHLAGPWWFAIKTDFAEGEKEWQEWKNDGKGWRRGREEVEAKGGGWWRWQREGVVVMQGGFCFLFNFLPHSLPSRHPLHPMSWVSVTFWTCQANTVEWLELSVKVMCCLPLEELRERVGGEGGKKRELQPWRIHYVLQINFNVWDRKQPWRWQNRSNAAQTFSRLKHHTYDQKHHSSTLTSVSYLGKCGNKNVLGALLLQVSVVCFCQFCCAQASQGLWSTKQLFEGVDKGCCSPNSFVSDW